MKSRFYCKGAALCVPVSDCKRHLPWHRKATEVMLYSGSTSVPDRRGRSTPHPGRLTPYRKETRYPLYWRLNVPQDRSERARRRESLHPPGFEPRTVQLVANRYTDILNKIVCLWSNICWSNRDTLWCHGTLWFITVTTKTTSLINFSAGSNLTYDPTYLRGPTQTTGVTILALVRARNADRYCDHGARKPCNLHAR